MGLSRIPAYAKEAENGLKRIRIFGLTLKALLWFVAAGAMVFCLTDALIFAGLSITFISFIFFMIGGASVLFGILGALGVVVSGVNRLKQELALRDRYDQLHQIRADEITELIAALEKLRQTVNESPDKSKTETIQKITEQINALRDNTTESIEEAQKKIKQVNKMIKTLYDKLHLRTPLHIPLQSKKKNDIPNNEPQSFLEKFWYYAEKVGNWVAAFIGGATTTLGIAGTWIGVAGFASLLVMPGGWMVLAGICVLALLVGVLTVCVENLFENLQEDDMEALTEMNHQIELDNAEIKWITKDVRKLIAITEQGAEHESENARLRARAYGLNIEIKPKQSNNERTRTFSA